MSELEYKGYIGRYEFDSELGCYHGEVANVCDVITFQGRDVEELRENLAASVDEYCCFCRDDGCEPKIPV